jgi:hypothetical protein
MKQNINLKELTLCCVSTSLFEQEYVLSDGTTSVFVDNIAVKWIKNTGLTTPVFSDEISDDMLEEWKFRFLLGVQLSQKQINKASMSKPTNPHRCDKKWGGITTPCKFACKKCNALYPVWGKFVKGDSEACEKCGYVYKFIDW